MNTVRIVVGKKRCGMSAAAFFMIDVLNGFDTPARAANILSDARRAIRDRGHDEVSS